MPLDLATATVRWQHGHHGHPVRWRAAAVSKKSSVMLPDLFEVLASAPNQSHHTDTQSRVATNSAARAMKSVWPSRIW